MKNTRTSSGVNALRAYILLSAINYQLFAGNTNITTDSGLSDEMKIFYSDYLIDTATKKLVHDQFAQKHPIPQGGGKTIQFRKYSPLPKMLTPLQEGVTPNGQKLTVSVLEASISQFGGFMELSDILKMTAIDNNLVQATKLLGKQAGETGDTITREVLNGGTNVQYAGDRVSARYLLVGGDATASNNHYMTVDAIKRAARYLKTMNAEPVDDSFVAIIHPDTAYDLTSDTAWVNVKTYSDPADMYRGEIGKIHGVRFVESSEAKIFHAENLTAAARNLTVKTTLSEAGKTLAVDEAITAGEATALVGRKIILEAKLYTIKSAAAGAAGAATITVADADPNISTTDGADGKIIYPGEAGAKGRDVYSTLVLGADAYGTTEIEGGGLEYITKPLGSGGTSDPLNQRATTGWKMTKVAKRLVEEYMTRVETAGTFQSGAN